METNTTQPAKQLPGDAMLQMIGGFWVSRAVWAAAELGLADQINGPTHVNDLAKANGLHARSLYRLMRALAGVGVFKELDGQRFERTELSDTLRSDNPDGLRSLATSELGHVHYASWGEILYCLRTGQPSFDKIYGMPVFDWFGKHRERADVFHRSMAEITRIVEPAVLKAYDFSDCGTVVDVGGGTGSLLIAILNKHKHLKGVVFDSENVVSGATPKLKEAGLADRCRTAAGDFFRHVPAGGNTYLMKHIIHDWDDEKCLKILKNCAAVMKPGDKVLVLDQVVPGPNEPALSKWMDLIMLQLPGGMERTSTEHQALLEKAGFTFSRIVPTESAVSIIEGIKR